MNDLIFNQLFELVKPLLKKGRDHDLEHTEISIEFMENILKGEKALNKRNILIPAIILHDIGWSKVGDKKNTEWSKKDLRIKHMKAGAKLAEKILKKVSYPNNLIKEIKELVENHDNFYLGIEPKTNNEKILRDADALYILSKASFWKDYEVNVINKGIKVSLKDFWVNQKTRYGKTFTKTGKKIINGLIEERLKEISLKQNERIL